MLWAVLLQMEEIMKVLEAIKKVFDKILEILGIITLGIMSVLVVYQVIVRYVFNAPSTFSGVLSQYLFVWMIMFGSAYVYGSREHLTIDLLKDKFPPTMNMVVEVITNICLLAFVWLVCVRGGWAYTVSQIKRIDSTLNISMSYIYAALPFTGIVTLFYAVYNCARAVTEYKEGKRKTGDPLGGTA
jgi:TRAP-type C4-dicarboxylate transport system permease small subunit